MTTKRRSAVRKTSTMEFLEKVMGGPLTLGGAIAAIREAEGESPSQFAEKLGVSHSSQRHRGWQAFSQSGERAAQFAVALGYDQAQFVRFALQSPNVCCTASCNR